VYYISDCGSVTNHTARLSPYQISIFRLGKSKMLQNCTELCSLIFYIYINFYTAYISFYIYYTNIIINMFIYGYILSRS